MTKIMSPITVRLSTRGMPCKGGKCGSIQGSQFTSFAFTSVLHNAEIRISMDGRGRWMDNVFIERLWRSMKYECVYPYAFETGSEQRAGLGRWITYYNTQRPHSGLAGQTPAEACRRIGQSNHGGHSDNRD